MSSNRFYLFCWAQVITLLGSELSRFALPLAVFEATGSNTHLSLIAFAGFAPRVFLGAFAGACADSGSLRRIVVITDIVQTVATFLMIPALSFLKSSHSISFLFLCALSAAAANAFQFPAVAKLIPKLAPKGLIEATAWVTTMERISALLGPLLAGLALAFVSVPALVAADAISFVLSTGVVLFAISGFKENFHSIRGRPSFWISSVHGIKNLFQNRRTAALLILAAGSNFWFSFALVLTTPALLVLGMSRASLGTVFSAAALGQVLASWITTKIPSPKNLLRAEIGGTVIIGALGFGLMGSAAAPTAIVVGYLILSALVPVMNIWNRANWYGLTPEKDQGQVFGSRRAVTSSLGAAGIALVGPVMDRWVLPTVQIPSLAYRYAFLFAAAALIAFAWGVAAMLGNSRE